VRNSTATAETRIKSCTGMNVLRYRVHIACTRG
jgi:hypothetical protein